MEFKLKKVIRHITLVYGFQSNDRIYDMVLTLQRINRSTVRVHGLLSKGTMSLHDFLGLWKFLKQNSPCKYFDFEVFPEHAKVYKLIMEIDKVILTKTFDDYECEILRIHRDAKIKMPGISRNSPNGPTGRRRMSKRSMRSARRK